MKQSKIECARRMHWLNVDDSIIRKYLEKEEVYITDCDTGEVYKPNATEFRQLQSIKTCPELEVYHGIKYTDSKGAHKISFFVTTIHSHEWQLEFGRAQSEKLFSFVYTFTDTCSIPVKEIIAFSVLKSIHEVSSYDGLVQKTSIFC